MSGETSVTNRSDEWGWSVRLHLMSPHITTHIPWKRYQIWHSMKKNHLKRYLDLMSPHIRGERIVFWGPNTNTNSIRPKKNTEYEYEYYSSIFFYRIRIRIIFVKNFPTNTNTNTIRQKISTEYEYEYYSVWKYHRIRIRIVDYSNIFEYQTIPSRMEIYAKF